MQDKNSLKSAIKEKPWAEKRNPFNYELSPLLQRMGSGAFLLPLLLSERFPKNCAVRSSYFCRTLLYSRVFRPVFYAGPFTHPLFLPVSFSPAFFTLSCRKLFYENFGCRRYLKLHGLSSYPSMHFYPCCRNVPLFSRLHGREESH